MIHIIKDTGQRIIKHSQGFFKTDLVFGYIAKSLLDVPLKLNTHSILNSINNLIHIADPCQLYFPS